MNRDQLLKALDTVVCKELNLTKDSFFLIGGAGMVVEDKLLGVKHITLCLKSSENNKVKEHPHRILVPGHNPEIYSVELSLEPVGIKRAMSVQVVVDDGMWRNCLRKPSEEGYLASNLDDEYIFTRFVDGHALWTADINPAGVIPEGRM